ncbi:MAG TPA: TolC family protein [Gemmatimonadaceae bacterium]
MRRRLLFTLLVVPSIAAAQTPNEGLPVVTLAEARRRSVTVDPDAVAARSRVDVASSERRSAFTNLITPNLRATTTYTHFSEPFFNFGTGGISPNSASATFDASYSILGAGKFGALKSARASLASAEALETSSRFRTMLETDAAYFAVLADKELSRVAQDRLRRAEEQLNFARVRVVAGEAVSSDSLRLVLEVSRARLGILSMDSSLTSSRLRLGRRIGLSGPAEAAPMDSLLPRSLPMSEEQAIAELRARGPEVEAARAQEKSANAAILSARERYLPEINIGATVGRYDKELFPDALKRNQWNMSLALPLWNGGSRELAVARARADRTVATAARADLERAAGETMAQAYRGYITARAGIDLAVVGLTAATENYRVQNARFKEGATTILDLLEAQVALTEAQAQLIRARFASRLSLAQIEALLGRRIFETPTPNVSKP